MEMSNHCGSHAEKARIWEERIRAWESSGLSQVAFCKQHGLKHSTFLYWRKRFSTPSQGNGNLRLVPISSPDEETLSPVRAAGIVVDVNGIRVEVSRAFEEDTLKRVLRAAKEV